MAVCGSLINSLFSCVSWLQTWIASDHLVQVLRHWLLKSCSQVSGGTLGVVKMEAEGGVNSCLSSSEAGVKPTPLFAPNWKDWCFEGSLGVWKYYGSDSIGHKFVYALPCC
ncbi:hypothetical protein FGO68_gene5775 [Halteria grandinella]|uniref:Uncharacterized protein n=1 Tax=Halteria grandinella TaxID=5974 RepID=A0A8J8NDG6_HALGN|nr:hypothetical protein FGO68_gene5775 [Halteria grandinella]